MNEPSNFINGQEGGCPNDRWNYPPYVPRKLKYRQLLLFMFSFVGTMRLTAWVNQSVILILGMREINLKYCEYW